jgi:hypothetical protein
LAQAFLCSGQRLICQSLQRMMLPGGYSMSVSPSRAKPALRQTALEAGWSVAGKACSCVWRCWARASAATALAAAVAMPRPWRPGRTCQPVS